MSNGSASSPEALVGLIDNLLKSASPPPDEVLRKVAKTLSQARGGTSQQTLSSTLISSSGGSSNVLKSSGSSNADHILSQAAAFYKKNAAGPSNILAAAPGRTPTEELDADDELGMSLPIYGKPDAVQTRILTRYAARQARTTEAPIPDVRQQITRQYQMLLEGGGGKVVHADVRQNGATQIGGMTSCTPSMTAGGGKNEMSRVASQLATRPPRIRNSPKDFRVA